MATKEYTVKTSEKEKLKRILSKYAEVKIIGEDKEQGEEAVKAAREDKKKRYNALAGKAVELGESVEELTSLSNRERAWRDEED